jgi:hypothetical protein
VQSEVQSRDVGRAAGGRLCRRRWKACGVTSSELEFVLQLLDPCVGGSLDGGGGSLHGCSARIALDELVSECKLRKLPVGTCVVGELPLQSRLLNGSRCVPAKGRSRRCSNRCTSASRPQRFVGAGGRGKPVRKHHEVVEMPNATTQRPGCPCGSRRMLREGVDGRCWKACKMDEVHAIGHRSCVCVLMSRSCTGFTVLNPAYCDQNPDRRGRAGVTRGDRDDRG